MTMTMIESVFPDVQGYFADVVTPGLARAIDDGAKVSFLQHEAHKWEKAEGKLAAWAQRSDETPHPFSPPLIETASVQSSPICKRRWRNFRFCRLITSLRTS
jgi:hypothetical protein